MADTYSRIYIHIVFAVQGRQNCIKKEFREELEKYIGGIIRNEKQKLFAIYCMPDHIHLLVSIAPDIKVSDLVRDIKANSSRFIKEKGWIIGKFSWQLGFGAFSYSHSQIYTITNYILN